MAAPDPNMSAKDKVAKSWMKTTVGKIGLTISLILCCILMIWGLVTGNFLAILGALTK